MPIKDLSNKGRIPRLGKIKLGIRTKTESKYPKMVDYFVCPEEIQAVYTEKPKKLPIAFHSDDIEEIFPQYYKRYGMSTGLVCKGDGEIASAINTDTKEFEEIECLGRECEHYKNNDCKHIGNLFFMVRGINRFGVYQLDTSSINSILNINGGLDYAKKLTGGRLNLVPFILEVIPQEVNPEGKKRTVYVLRLEADINAMKKALRTEPNILAIEDSKIPEEKDIEECLYPEQVVESLKVTEKQLAKMWVMVKDAGIEVEQFKRYLIENYKVESSKELTKEQLQDIFDYLEEKMIENLPEEAEEVEPEVLEQIKQETLT